MKGSLTIKGNGQTLEYRARNQRDARLFIERALQRHFASGNYNIIHEGDAVVHFVYHQIGD